MKKAFSIFLIIMGWQAFAQLGGNPIGKGNDLYEKEKYDEAEINYRQALQGDEDEATRGQFNLGDALYKQERFEEAAREFSKVAATAENDKVKAQALHNLGNTMLKQQKLEEAVNSYKNALRLNPEDEETRYNLAKSMRAMQQQKQQQQQNQDQDKKENQEKNEQEKQDQKQDQQNDKNQQPQQDEGEPKDPDQGERNKQPDSKQGEGKPREGKISREDAERLLEALSKQEQKVQQKVNEDKIKEKPVRTEKDW